MIIRSTLTVLLVATSTYADLNANAVLNGFDVSNSIIPVSEIRRGGPPRDGIPAIDHPKMISHKVLAEGDESQRVLGISLGGKASAYPLLILTRHEVVNDQIDGIPVAITFCPLCGSGMTFQRKVLGIELTFGVSGLLYQSDVLMYDRQTESLWSQLLAQAISGPLAGTKLEYVATEETTLKSWASRHPNTLVLSQNTGYARSYKRNPYEGYLGRRSLVFPVNNRADDRFHPKEKVLGLLGKDSSWAIPYSELSKQGDPITIELDGQTLTVFYDSDSNSAQVRTISGELYPSITAFYFAWYTFHPNTQIYENLQSRSVGPHSSLNVRSSTIRRHTERTQNANKRRKLMNSAELDVTTNNFEKTIGQGVSLVDFWAPWCGPCRTQGPIVNEVAELLGEKVTIGKLNVDENQEIASRYGVSSIPTLIIFKDGQEAERLIGVRRRDELIEKLESYL